MSESIELDTGQIDHGGGERKRKRDSDGKKEAEEEPKAKRQKVMDSSEGNDQTAIAPTDVPPEAELGDSSGGPFQEEQTSAAEENQEEQPSGAEENQEEQTRAAEENQEEEEPEEEDVEDETDIFLFELPVEDENNLTIPAEIAREHFPTLSFTGEEKTLEIDDLGQIWKVSFRYNQDIDAFTPTNDQWQQISNHYNLSLFAPCSILFYEPAFRFHTAHFFFEFERRTEYQVQDLSPIFRDENFLFEVELEESDVRMARLFLPVDIVHDHFKVIFIPARSQNQVAMKFTDAQGRNWYMEMIRYNDRKYMIIKLWDAFVRERGLEAMDAVRFYKPDNRSHLKHFLIAIVKKDCRTSGRPTVLANSNQPGGGGGADRKGPSTSNGSRKGKECPC